MSRSTDANFYCECSSSDCKATLDISDEEYRTMIHPHRSHGDLSYYAISPSCTPNSGDMLIAAFPRFLIYRENDKRVRMKITLEIESAIPLDVLIANFPRRLFVSDTSLPKIHCTGSTSSSHPMSPVKVKTVVAVVCSYNHETLRSKSDRMKCPECGEGVK